MAVHHAPPAEITHATIRSSVASSVGPRVMDASGDISPRLEKSRASSADAAKDKAPPSAHSGQRQPPRPTNDRASSAVNRASNTSPTCTVRNQTQSHHSPVNRKARTPKATIHSRANDRIRVRSLCVRVRPTRCLIPRTSTNAWPNIRLAYAATCTSIRIALGLYHSSPCMRSKPCSIDDDPVLC